MASGRFLASTCPQARHMMPRVRDALTLSKGVQPRAHLPVRFTQYASQFPHSIGGIVKKVEEASVIAALGVDVAIAMAGSDAGRLACQFSPRELKQQLGWRGTCVWRAGS